MKYLEDIERRKIIRRSESMWRNPIKALEKANWKDIRVMSNLLALNDLVEKNPYEIPNRRELLRAIQGKKLFTVFDLKEGFYHIKIEEKNKEKTEFEVDGRVYEWKNMVMGFKNTPNTIKSYEQNIRIFERKRSRSAHRRHSDICKRTDRI